MERKGTTSWSRLPTRRLPNFCPRSPQEPQTRSRPDWLAGLHGTTIPSRVGVAHPPVSSLFYPNPEMTTPLSYYVFHKPRFVPLLWWRGGVTFVYEQTYPNPVTMNGNIQRPNFKNVSSVDESTFYAGKAFAALSDLYHRCSTRKSSLHNTLAQKRSLNIL